MNKLVIIFGYNNTRVYDIERLKKMCRESLDAEIMLCKEKITQVDLDITPYVLEVDITKFDDHSIKEQIRSIDEYIASRGFDVIACLPFSDKGIPLGSHYARKSGLNHDKCETSVACIDKYEFRVLERDVATPKWYKKPFFRKIHTISDARTCINNSTMPLFFKPVAEGNSRGCLEINSIQDLEENFDIVEAYLEQGIVVEECIKDCDEYSFDGIDGNYIITEKKTSQGYYRVETQHILPAPLDPMLYDRLIEAGKIVSRISGSNGGAVHNELFLNKKTGEVYCVEPNRRPAGLKLWDWISTAYPNVDNWTAWINWASNIPNTTKLTANKYYVGCRMMKSNKSGQISSINDMLRTKLISMESVCDLVLTKKVGQNVTSNLKDNSDFTGYFVCKSDSPECLLKTLDLVEQEVSQIYTVG